MPQPFNGQTATASVELTAEGIELAAEVIANTPVRGEVVDVAADLTALLDGLQPGAVMMTHDQIWLLYNQMRAVSYMPPRWAAARQVLDELRAKGESFYKD